MITVAIDGVTYGVVDPDTLTIEDQIELEESRGAKSLVAWMKAHAGTTDQQAGAAGEAAAAQGQRAV